MKYIEKFRRFMYGRYGIDELYQFLLKLYVFLLVLNIFLKSKIITIIELIVITVMFGRLFSKNFKLRRKENALYLKFKNLINKPFINLKRNIKDKEHVYKKCRKCKTVLKLPLPSKRGLKKAKCPHCGNRVKIFTFKQEKIEIIRDKK